MKAAVLRKYSEFYHEKTLPGLKLQTFGEFYQNSSTQKYLFSMKKTSNSQQTNHEK